MQEKPVVPSSSWGSGLDDHTGIMFGIYVGTLKSSLLQILGLLVPPIGTLIISFLFVDEQTESQFKVTVINGKIGPT